MSGHEFSVRYPLFALKRQTGYVAFDLGPARPGATGFGVPVFTTPGNVVQFLSHTSNEARVMTFDRVGVFRQFLRPLRDQGTVVLFDLLPDGQGNLHTAHAYPAAMVLERFLPEAGFTWDYPVYVLKHQNGLACVQGEHGGTTGNWLAVFTDPDLAERAVAAASQSLVAEPVANRQAYARLLRGMSADVIGVAYDPPDHIRVGRSAIAMHRRQLLANLEIEI